MLDLTASRAELRFVDVAGAAGALAAARFLGAGAARVSDYSPDDLAFLAAHDSDPVNRWDAAQRSFADAILRCSPRRIAAGGRAAAADPALAALVRALLADDASDPALVALALTPPDLAYLAGLVATIDVDALFAAREFVDPRTSPGSRATRCERCLRDAPRARRLRADAGADRRAAARQPLPRATSARSTTSRRARWRSRSTTPPTT